MPCLQQARFFRNRKFSILAEIVIVMIDVDEFGHKAVGR